MRHRPNTLLATILDPSWSIAHCALHYEQTKERLRYPKGGIKESHDTKRARQLIPPNIQIGRETNMVEEEENLSSETITSQQQTSVNDKATSIFPSSTIFSELGS